MARKLVTKAQGRTIAQNISAFGPWTKGVNEKNEVFLLNADEFSNAENSILDDQVGVVHKRPGSVFVSAVPFLVNTPKVGYVFKTGNGNEILVLTDNFKVVVTEDMVNYMDITPAAFLLNGKFAGGDSIIDFATAEGLLWMTNGADPVCSWDGLSAVVVYDKAVPEVTWDGVAPDAQSFLADALLDRASDGTTWIGQVITCTLATNVGNIGISAKITSFDDATNKIGFPAFPFTITAGDKFAIGVAIPRGRYVKYHHNTLFLASTPENVEEIRFHNDVDPNEPNITIQINNPNAWPPVNQFVVGSGGDRIWGFTSPVYRDRIGAFKSTGLYRIEPDATFRFVPITITEQFGSRFASSWQQHGDVLKFLGEDTDGRPDIMTTDFVTVKHMNRKHSRTLDNLRQPRAIFKDRIFSSEASFNSGTRSSFADTVTSELKAGSTLDTLLYGPNVVSSQFVDLLTNPGNVTGALDTEWTTKYDANELPQSATPAWSVTQGNAINASANGILTVTYNGGTDPTYTFQRNNVFNPAQVVLIKSRFKIDKAGIAAFVLDISSGAWQSRAFMRTAVTGFENANFNGQPIPIVTANEWHTIAITLTPGGFTELWVDNVSVSQWPPTATLSNYVNVDMRINNSSPFSVNLDLLYINDNYQGLSEIVLLNDMTRVPTQLAPIFTAATLTGLSAGIFTYSWTSDTPDFSASNDPAGYVLVANGAVPTSQVRRYQRIKVQLQQGDPLNPTVLTYLSCGAIWTSPAISLGANIAAWLNFKTVNTVPAGASIVYRVRYAVVTTVPLPSDFGPYNVITNNQNIGTVMGDVLLPPAARWVQVDVELNGNATGGEPRVSSIDVEWFDGSSVTLPVSSIIYNKKWLLTAATSLSGSNDIIISSDSNDALVNWTGLATNLFVWFKNKLYISRGNEIMELTANVLSDDTGPAAPSGRTIVPINAFLETNQEIGGAVAIRKKPRYLDVIMSDDGPTIQVSYKRDDQVVFTPLLTIPFANGRRNYRINFPLGFQYYRLIVRLENNQLNTDFLPNGMVLVYATVPAVSGL